MEACFERFGGDEAHPVFGLVSLVADLLREYEDREYPWPNTTTPAELLAYLMEAHGLKPSDLPDVGPQSVVSAIVSGKRQLGLNGHWLRSG